MKINLNNLRSCLGRPLDEIFPAYLPKDTRYLWVRNRVPTKVLAVCHLDTVQPLSSVCLWDKKADTLNGSGFDDRLGYYIISELLDKLGCPCDFLFTDNEEKGQSTAEFFHGGDQYNWIVEFDRAGEDVVTYGLAGEDLEASLESCGFKIGRGTFSDICWMSTTTARFNVGIGYAGAHSKNSTVNLGQLRRQLKRFVKFYQRFKGTRFESPIVDSWGSFDSKWDSWGQDSYTYPSYPTKQVSSDICEYCGCVLRDRGYVLTAWDDPTDSFCACPTCKDKFKDTYYVENLG